MTSFQEKLSNIFPQLINLQKDKIIYMFSWKLSVLPKNRMIFIPYLAQLWMDKS